MADSIFSEDELKAAAEAAEVQPDDQQQQTETQAEQPRDEQGRFVPKEKTEGDEGKPPEGHVPQGALHAERERRKGVEAELKKAQEALSAIAQLKQQVASRAPAQTQAPPEGDNGVEHLTKRLQELEQQTIRVGQTIDHQNLEAQENAHIQSVLAHSEANFRQQTPDYDDAIRYVIQARANELSLYGMSPHDVRIALANEVADIARSAISQGKDPAELGYAIAQSRGYRPGEQQNGQGQGKAAAKVDAIAQAKASNRSIGHGAGSTPAGELTAEQVIAMSPEEFSALYDTPEGRRLIDSVCGAH